MTHLSTELLPVTGSPDSLDERFQRVRSFSERIAETLEPEDCVIQSMPDVSPTRWHLAHTTWFFETFLLRPLLNVEPYDQAYEYLFNSYYNTVGKQFPRPHRGLLSRPTLREVMAYRHHVTERVVSLLRDSAESTTSHHELIVLGLNHEQQHQELMLTDIKHVFSCNPLFPALRPGTPEDPTASLPPGWVEYDEGVIEIGKTGDGFAFDNESPRHRKFVESYALAKRLVTSGEYQQFINDGGYRRPELWLSMGWSTVQEQQWTAPLHWVDRDDEWHQFTLAGLLPLDADAPICHLSYFEADAYARWAGARLPTETEWELACQQQFDEADLSTANWSDVLIERGAIVHPAAVGVTSKPLSQLFGEVWEWTASPYTAYPGYAPPSGAIGEYNGKFMCNQYVLRGGSCATPSGHVRPTYRNFFPPESRWQFTGLRLAR